MAPEEVVKRFSQRGRAGRPTTAPGLAGLTEAGGYRSRGTDNGMGGAGEGKLGWGRDVDFREGAETGLKFRRKQEGESAGLRQSPGRGMIDPMMLPGG